MSRCSLTLLSRMMATIWRCGGASGPPTWSFSSSAPSRSTVSGVFNSCDRWRRKRFFSASSSASRRRSQSSRSPSDCRSSGQRAQELIELLLLRDGLFERRALLLVKRQEQQLVGNLPKTLMYPSVVDGQSGVFDHRQLLRQALDRADAAHQRAAGARCLRRAEHRGAALLGEPLRVPGRIRERHHERQRDHHETGQQQAKKRSRIRHVPIISTKFPLVRGSMSHNAEPRIYLVAAVAANGIIGANGQLPWHLPEDLTHFKQLTLGHPVIMGRRTWESLALARGTARGAYRSRRHEVRLRALRARLALRLEYANLRQRKAIELARVGGRVRARVLDVHEIAFLQVRRQRFIAHDDVHRVAGRTADGPGNVGAGALGADAVLQALAALDHAAEKACVPVHPALAGAGGCAEHAADEIAGVVDQEAAGLGDHLHVLGKGLEALVHHLADDLDRRDRLDVPDRKPTADIEQARLQARLAHALEERSRLFQGDAPVLRVAALRTDVERYTGQVRAELGGQGDDLARVGGAGSEFA